MPNHPNAAIVQGSSDTPEIDSFPIAARVTAMPPISGGLVVTDIEDGAGDSIMEPAINAARVRSIPAIISGAPSQVLGSSRWIDDESGVRCSIQATVYEFANTSGTPGGFSSIEGHSVITLLSSGARTTAQSTSLQQTTGRRGIRIFVNVTAVPGAGGITPRVTVRDPVSLVERTVWTAAAAITTTGLHTYLLYPGAPFVSADTEAVGIHLGANYRVLMNVASADSYTYSLGCERLV